MAFGDNDAPYVPGSGFGSGDAPVGGTPPTPELVDSISSAFVHGLQNSSMGLALRGKLPEQQLSNEAPWQQRITAGAAGIVGDFIPGVAGAIGGSLAGTAVAGPVGSVVGGGAGAFAVPMALRDGLVEAYGNNNAASWGGAWDIVWSAMKGGAKGAVIGGATAGAGRVVAPLLAPAGKIATTAGVLGTELSTLTTTSAALEGHMPTAQDFVDNAILLGGMKAVVSTAGKLRSVYAQTGKKPAEILKDAEADPVLKAEITSTAPDAPTVPTAYKALALEERVKAALAVEESGVVADVLQHAKDPTTASKSPVRYEYITDRLTAESVVREVATAYEIHVEKQRRGTVPTKASFAEGARLAEEGLLDPHTIGRASNDAEIVARATLTKGAAERARSIAEEIARIPSEVEVPVAKKLELAGALDQVRMFYGDLAGAGAEAGRALRMLGEIKRNPERLGDAKAMLEAYEAKKGGKIEDIAALARTLTNTEALRKFAEKVEKATTFEMIVEGWKASILSGIHTTGANVIGNTARWTVETALTNPLTQTFEAARLAMKGDPMSLAAYKARIIGPIMGIQLGAADAVKIAGEVWKQRGEHLEKADVYKTAIPGTTGHVIRAPFRFLQVQDAFFRTFAEREKAYVMAVERAAKEGNSPGTMEFNNAVQRYVDEPTLGLSVKEAQAVTAKIEAHGAESVFAQRLGPRMEGISRSIQGSVFEFIFPFRRTPVNLVSWAMQYTPGLNLMSTRWWSDVRAGGELQSRALARVAIGTGLAMAAYELAEEGILTGSGLFDKEAGGAKRGAGWQPNSLFIGGEYYSIERIEPVAKILITASNLYELQKASADKEDKAKLGMMAVALFANATISTTYMSGLSNAMAAVKEPERYMDSFIEQYATSLVPKIVGQTVGALDPHKREVEGVVQAIQSQLPYFRSKLLPARDVWGEPSSNNKWFYVMPVSTSKESQDKVKTEAMRLAVAIGDVPKSVQESGPFKPSDMTTVLSQEERNQFRGVRGEEAMKLLTPLVNSPDWERLPAFAQAQAFKDAFEYASKMATQKVLPADDQKRIQAREKIIDRITRESQAVDSKASPR
jgi:hypothetical protein